MKRLLYALLAILPMSLAAADINITNIPAGGAAITDKLLGVTNNNWSALVTIQQVANLSTNGLAPTNWVATYFYNSANPSGYVTSSVTNGLVDSSVTNGLAPTNWVATYFYNAANPSGYVTASVTNGLATTNWVGAYFYNAANLAGYVTASVTNGLVMTNDSRPLYFTNMSNTFSGNGGGLTNVPFSIWTNFVVAPNSMTNLNGLGFAPGFGMIATWTLTNIANVGPVGIRVLVADTNCFITTNGGTFTGTILDNSVTSLAPANNQLVTASWVRNLFAGSGVSYYATTNTAIGFTNADVAATVVYAFDTSIPAHATRLYTAPAASSYVGSVAVTNRLLQLNAGVTVNAYLENSGGTGAKTISVHPEIYYSYDGTNWAGDWSASAQAITSGVTNLYTWVISNPQYTATNATGFFVQRRFKVDAQSGNPNLTFHLGLGTPSHITLSGATSSSGNAFLAASQTFTGTNNFTGPLLQNGVPVLTNSSNQTITLSGDATGSGTTAITVTVTNVQQAIITNQVYATNVIGRAIYATNSYDGLTIDATKAQQTFNTNASYTVAGFSGLVSGFRHVVSICVSNYGASAITIAGPPTTKYIGSVSTNSMSLPSYKQAYFTYDIRPTVATNGVNAVEQ